MNTKTAPSRATTMSIPRTASGGTMPSASRATQRVTLFTDRSLFAQQWTRALSDFGLEASTAVPSQLPRSLERGAAVVIDAGAESYDDDDGILAHVGLARALGALPVVSVPGDVDASSIDDLLDELCAGLVARRPEDVERIAGGVGAPHGSRSREPLRVPHGLAARR
ncbi:MAG: hypothetical protein M5U28_12725 [Sandaracinaceae bacterium]|nr:hypothetical protein [Sandaracinaceae bacterium]